MERLKTLRKRLLKLDEAYLLKLIFVDPAFKKLIIELNTNDQLYNKGIDSLGRELGNYSPATIEGTKNFPGKIEKGQRYDHITLNDTGKFYESFKVTLKGTEIIITAQTLKEDTDLLKEWGEEILGLTNENLQRVIDKAREILVPKVREYLLAA